MWRVSRNLVPPYAGLRRGPSKVWSSTCAAGQPASAPPSPSPSPLAAPFDLSQSVTRDCIRARLQARAQQPSAYTFHARRATREAAVLLPLCTIGGQPSVLFTVRSMSLSTHQGEISFPGGMRDPTDPSPEYTSLRETFEEIHIDPDRIAILGGTHAVPNVDGTIRVHPYIGVIDGGAPLDPGTLKYNRAELSKVFGLSVAELLDPDCRTMVPFRKSKYKIPEFRTPPDIEPRIWGLTAFILNDFLNVVTDPALDESCGRAVGL